MYKKQNIVYKARGTKRDWIRNERLQEDLKQGPKSKKSVIIIHLTRVLTVLIIAVLHLSY